MPAKEPVPTPAGPTQLKVGLGDFIVAAAISVCRRREAKREPRRPDGAL